MARRICQRSPTGHLASPTQVELRARAFANVERLLALVAAGEGDLGDRVMALAGDDFRAAALAMLALGGVDP